MTRTSVYAVSSKSGLPIVWRLARATSTQPAPTSKPAGFPPCDTHRSVGPHTPPPSPRWRSGSKPWRHLTFPYPHLYYPPQPVRHPHHDAAKGPSPPHPQLSHLPHPQLSHLPHPQLSHLPHRIRQPPPPPHTYHHTAAAPAFKLSSLPLQPASPPPLCTPLLPPT